MKNFQELIKSWTHQISNFIKFSGKSHWILCHKIQVYFRDVGYFIWPTTAQSGNGPHEEATHFLVYLWFALYWEGDLRPSLLEVSTPNPIYMREKRERELLIHQAIKLFLCGDPLRYLCEMQSKAHAMRTFPLPHTLSLRIS